MMDEKKPEEPTWHELVRKAIERFKSLEQRVEQLERRLDETERYIFHRDE